MDFLRLKPDPEMMIAAALTAVALGAYLLLSTRPSVESPRRASLLRASRPPEGRRVAGARSLLAAALILFGFGAIFAQAYIPATADPALEALRRYLTFSGDGAGNGFAYTDMGGEVALYSPAAKDQGLDLARLEEQAVPRKHLSFRVLRTAAASAASNCHGWVFAGGRYWVDSDGVEKVLLENSYVEVGAPREGDIIIYRSGGGAIAHSGVVRVVLPGDRILVESKWGKGGRFIHPPETYAEANTSWRYYRTSRGGHLLQERYPGEAPTLVSDGRAPAAALLLPN